jgi:hypothetical protein
MTNQAGFFCLPWEIFFGGVVGPGLHLLAGIEPKSFYTAFTNRQQRDGKSKGPDISRQHLSVTMITEIDEKQGESES